MDIGKLMALAAIGAGSTYTVRYEPRSSHRSWNDPFDNRPLAGIKPEGNPDIKYDEGKRRSSKRRARRQRGKGRS